MGGTSGDERLIRKRRKWVLVTLQGSPTVDNVRITWALWSKYACYPLRVVWSSIGEEDPTQ